MATETFFYLKISGVRGDVKIKPYDGWIEAESCTLLNLGNNLTNSSTGRKSNDYYLGVLIPYQKATFQLEQAYVSHATFTEAIVAVKRGNAEILRYTMSDYVSINEASSGLGEAPDFFQFTSKKLVINHGLPNSPTTPTTWQAMKR